MNHSEIDSKRFALSLETVGFNVSEWNSRVSSPRGLSLCRLVAVFLWNYQSVGENLCCTTVINNWITFNLSDNVFFLRAQNFLVLLFFLWLSASKVKFVFSCIRENHRRWSDSISTLRDVLFHCHGFEARFWNLFLVKSSSSSLVEHRDSLSFHYSRWSRLKWLVIIHFLLLRLFISVSVSRKQIW